ncbi:MAG: threonylcarbamoyl-AMP synthase [Nitrososphaerota archaeon]|nr:threonylcarbamoyl-AMP synthase [Nitrososphaerota archaeon]MDG6940000.1 threonylcarbamoyl-AMP synthase [Nitrososphaerota archaeon]
MRAAELIRRGEVVAFPTETVYGLGADATSASAVDKVYQAKGRPSDNPLIVHIASFQQLRSVVRNPPERVRELAAYYWPGPLTLIFEKSASISDAATAGLGSVAVRMPAHPVALELIRRSGRPIAAPSANLSGRPSPTLPEHVLADMEGRIPLLLDGGPATYGVESTVLDMTADPPMILRPGPVTAEDLAPLVDGVAFGGGTEGQPRAPGMKYTHYAPKAPLLLVVGGANSVADKMLPVARLKVSGGATVGLLCTDETLERFPPDIPAVSLGSRFAPYGMAKNLYASLRKLDEMGVGSIVAEGFTGDGIYATIMNRLRKAASEIIEDGAADEVRQLTESVRRHP